MKKAILSAIVLFVICAFTAVISLFACGAEALKSAVSYGIEQYREYRVENHTETDISI